jgi:small neutral amino acid transporter SnatA (MarC family)
MTRSKARSAAWFGAPLLTSGVLAIGVISPPEHCPEVTEAELMSSATAAAGWLVDNQHDDGSYLYEYDASSGIATDTYNVVRHSGVMMSLYGADAYAIDGTLESADRGLEWWLPRLTEGDGWLAAGENDVPSVGATALLVAGLALRRDETGDDRHDALMTELGRFLVGQVEPSGAVSARYDAAAGRPIVGSRSIYYAGELYWALVLLDRQFPQGGWGEPADRVGAYIAGPRDVEEDLTRTRDHWAAYGLSATNASGNADHDRPLTPVERDYIRRQSRLVGVAVRWNAQQSGPWGTMVRGTTWPRGGGWGTIGEQVTGLWRATRVEPELADLHGAIGDRARCLAALTIDHQSEATDVRERGAWFVDGVTRMDDQQHALSALLDTIPIVRAVEAGDADAVGNDDRGERPPVALWIVALLAAVNPVRVARRLERTAAVGRQTAIGFGVLVAAAAAGGALLDWLDISNAAFRLSAGSLAAVAAASILVASATRRQWSTAVLPAIVNPAAVVVAIGFAADRSGWLAIAVLAVAAGLAALVSRMPQRSTWSVAAGAFDAALLVAGMILMVSGVLTV